MDTIVALATPPGRGAIGVVRISGPASLSITHSLVSDGHSGLEHSRVVLKHIRDSSTHDVIDQALISVFQSPNSFTGEDVVEISCHGSPVVLRRVIDLILRLGARLATPGEFTLRALMNGKLNLSEAEAIRDLIEAHTEAAAKQAVRQLNGELSLRLQPLKHDLLSLIVPLESAVEFVEDDLPQVQSDRLAADLKKLISEIEILSSTYGQGHLLRDGVKVTLVGPPNSGKSTLFNSLLGIDRAIVTEIPGTTRDTLTEFIIINGVPIALTDTAGVRESTEHIETIGIERTRAAMADADLLLIVIDGSTNLTDEELVFLRSTESRRAIVLNKSDLSGFRNRLNGEVNDHARVISVSAKAHLGLDELRAAILEPFELSDSQNSGLLITNARHYDLLTRACRELEFAQQHLLNRASEELILVGLHNALRFVGEISGETTTEEMLSEIFSTFCIGK